MHYACNKKYTSNTRLIHILAHKQAATLAKTITPKTAVIPYN
jgi:hypothetical protein